MGCDTSWTSSSTRSSRFQSTHPVWDATASWRGRGVGQDISIHASRMGCDHISHVARIGRFRFQSTHPVWDATPWSRFLEPTLLFQSTHPVWDATSRKSATCQPIPHFNPRIPYGMRLKACEIFGESCPFQSTHPVWDATQDAKFEVRTWLFQSTHPVWDATPSFFCPAGRF